MKRLSILLFVLTFLGCASGPLLIEDVRTLPQESGRYLDLADRDVPLISPALQEKFNQTYDSLYFRPWHPTNDTLKSKVIQQIFSDFKKNPGWSENRMPRDLAWIEALETNAGLEDFPNAGWSGITTANTDLRAMPTSKPIFNDFNLPGEGYPFDYLQVSSIAVNTPVRVLHYTRDKSWFYVSSPIAPGWLPARDVAQTDSLFLDVWEHADRVMLIRDEVPVYNIDGAYLFHAPLGAVFPKIDDDSLSFLIFAAQPEPGGRAVLVTASLPKTSAVDKPLLLTLANLVKVTDALIGEPYGWGGLFENRDCSAAMQDLFAPFGVRLPRHSAHQVESGFGTIDLSGLSPAEKERRIIEKGIPFLTLLGLRGHIMLYIGHSQDHALVFHNLWAIRTKSFWGKEGRKIVGKAVVTTLSPGRGVPHADSAGDILRRIQSMAFVVPPDSVRWK